MKRARRLATLEPGVSGDTRLHQFKPRLGCINQFHQGIEEPTLSALARMPPGESGAPDICGQE
eukprot:6180693-Pleurochrysis_carterae.AAC.1